MAKEEMKLHCLGSGSSGNCWIIECEYEALVIDAGVSFVEVKKALWFQTSKIVAVIVSHSHGDHNKYVDQFRKYGVPVVQPDEDCHLKYGRFAIGCHEIYHDVKNFLFYIAHPEIGNILYVTDTNAIPYKLEGLNHLIVEANYDPGIIHEKVLSGNLNAQLSARIENSHMSIETIEKWLTEQDLSQVANIVLCHLSSVNSDAGQFKTRIERATGKPVKIARKGLTINL